MHPAPGDKYGPPSTGSASADQGSILISGHRAATDAAIRAHEAQPNEAFATTAP
jgi:hypothetical protein